MFPLLALFLWLAGLQQRQNVPLASIEGVVVRAGAVAAAAPEGLMNAQVEIRPGNRSIPTDASGAFRFRNLDPGQYTISFSHAGFVPLEDPKRGLTESGLTLNLTAGQTLKEVVLPMIPAPLLGGTVFGPDGQPLPAALVRAYERQYSPYGSKLKIVRKAMTDDMGEFRLFGLRFGQFFVSAGYSDRDRAAAVGKTQLSENVSKADDGYATVFYDGVEELSMARGTRIAPGSDPGSVNIYLRDSARFKVRGHGASDIVGHEDSFRPERQRSRRRKIIPAAQREWRLRNSRCFARQLSSPGDDDGRFTLLGRRHPQHQR